MEKKGFMSLELAIGIAAAALIGSLLIYIIISNVK